jgi:hypothetical protein
MKHAMNRDRSLILTIPIRSDQNHDLIGSASHF